MGSGLTIPVEQELTTSVPTTPIIEELLATGLTSPGGGAHDEGDPSAKEAWTMMIASGEAA